MELTSEKPWKYLTLEVLCIKGDALSHVELQVWADNIEDTVYPIFPNLLERLQGLEGGLAQEGFMHGEDNRLP